MTLWEESCFQTLRAWLHVLQENPGIAFGEVSIAGEM